MHRFAKRPVLCYFNYTQDMFQLWDYETLFFLLFFFLSKRAIMFLHPNNFWVNKSIFSFSSIYECDKAKADFFLFLLIGTFRFCVSLFPNILLIALFPLYSYPAKETTLLTRKTNPYTIEERLWSETKVRLRLKGIIYIFFECIKHIRRYILARISKVSSAVVVTDSDGSTSFTDIYGSRWPGNLAELSIPAIMKVVI